MRKRLHVASIRPQQPAVHSTRSQANEDSLLPAVRSSPKKIPRHSLDRLANYSPTLAKKPKADHQPELLNQPNENAVSYKSFYGRTSSIKSFSIL